MYQPKNWIHHSNADHVMRSFMGYPYAPHMEYVCQEFGHLFDEYVGTYLKNLEHAGYRTAIELGIHGTSWNHESVS